MHIRTRALAGLLLFGAASGCAGTHSTAQMQKLATQVAQLDARVGAIEQHGHAATPDLATWDSEGAPTATASLKASLPKPTTMRIQRALKSAGYYTGEADGKMGPKTKQAIKDFQRANELVEDGKVGSKTWAKLSTHLSTE